MDINYVVADPAGNITGLVLTELPRSDYKMAARYLMEHAGYGLEQVGFIRDCNDCDGSLEMMGGEFCGNAARSVGLYLAQNQISLQDDKVLIRVSGVRDMLEVQTDLRKHEAKIKMPPVLSIGLVQTRQYGTVPLIKMEGISHVLLIDVHPETGKAEELIQNLAEAFDDAAIGIMFYEAEHHFVTPLVWVRETDTMIWESSCGSGSVALASYLERDTRGNWVHTFKEPGGILRVEGNQSAIYLGGPVTFSAILSAAIPEQLD